MQFYMSALIKATLSKNRNSFNCSTSAHSVPEFQLLGLPTQQSNGENLSQQIVAVRDCNHELQPSSPRRVSSRKAPPTELGIFDQLQPIWDRTKRLKEPNLSAARILLQERLDFVEDQITAMHPNMLPSKLTRIFSSSDIMKGRHKQ
jgi:hypothetical protein